MWSPAALIAEGDDIIFFVSRDSLHADIVDRSATYNCKHGAFPHAELIGKPYGSQVMAKNKRGFCYVLRPTPELWTLSLPHRTQILYHPDISFITAFLDVRPGSRIAEAGTGSGSFTHSLARTVGSTGQIFSFEFHQERYEKARKEFEQHGILNRVKLAHRDVVKNGLGLEEEVDAVFLDLPTPELALPSARAALRKDRVTRICCFSPCIEQVLKTVAELNKHGFTDVTMYETLVRNFDTIKAGLPTVQSAIDRIADVETRKSERRHIQIAQAKAKKQARIDAEAAAAAAAAAAVEGEGEGDETSEPPAKRAKLMDDLPTEGSATPAVDSANEAMSSLKAKGKSKNATVLSAVTSAGNESAPRPLYQQRGHTSYLTFATLLPSTAEPLATQRTYGSLLADVSFVTPDLSASGVPVTAEEAMQE